MKTYAKRSPSAIVESRITSLALVSTFLLSNHCTHLGKNVYYNKYKLPWYRKVRSLSQPHRLAHNYIPHFSHETVDPRVPAVLATLQVEDCLF